nr:MAG TPA: hypothetical protein [Bacteriophage sp.]
MLYQQHDLCEIHRQYNYREKQYFPKLFLIIYPAN